MNSPHTSCRRFLCHTSLKNLAIRQVFLHFFASSGAKIARQSVHDELISGYLVVGGGVNDAPHNKSKMDKSQNYPVRKSNRLNTYDYSTAGMYFITICARNKEKLFGWMTDGDELHLPQMLLSETGRIVEEQILTIQNAKYVLLIKHVVMPNHLHMILQVEEGAEEKKMAANAVIPHAIGSFKRLCTNRIGENVFQRSFHDRVIRNQREFEKIWTYIENNPCKWKEDCFYIENSEE